MKKLCLILFFIGIFNFSRGQEWPELIPVLDSVYDFNWVGNNWVVKTKNYKIKDGSGNVVQDLYLKINPMNGQWSYYMRNNFDYQGEVFPKVVEGQYWTITGDWITFQYSHYVTKNNMDETYTKDWNQMLQKFTGGTRTLNTYIGKNLSQRVYQSLDTLTWGWVNAVKYDFLYNASNLKQDEVIMVWNGNAWINNYRVTDDYDANNQLLLHQEYTWDDMAGNWMATFRTSNTYQMVGMKIYTLTESWDNFAEEWDSVQKVNYVYGEGGKLFNAYAYNKDPETEDWQPYSITAYSYFPDGKLYSHSLDVWNPIGQEWINLTSNHYDSVTQLIDSVVRFVDYTSYLVTSGIHQINVFNSFSDIQESVFQNLDVTTGNWVNHSKETYQYDNLQYITEKMTQVWNNAWENSTLTRYYYTNVNGVNDPLEQKYCSFSNPLRTGSSISCPLLESGHRYDLRLISLSGGTIWSGALSGGGQLNIPSDLTTGMYLLQISENGKQISAQKVIIIH